MTSPHEPTCLLVRASAGIGDWRDSFDLPPEQQASSPIVSSPTMLSSGAFCVAVRTWGERCLYREASLLVVVPLDCWSGVLTNGQRVVLQRIRDQVEVTVREVDVTNGRAWLRTGCDDQEDPRCSPIEMPWPCATRVWRHGEDRFLIAGVVVEALTPET